MAILNPANSNIVQMILRIFLIISFVLNYYHCKAQSEFRFKHLGFEEGFPQSTTLCMLQDNQGFMWFGSQDGLIRYDGYNFKLYRHDPEKQNSLGNNYITDIKEDPGGKFIWLSTRGGVSRFEKATGDFENYNPIGSGMFPTSGLIIDNDGKIWVAERDFSFTFFPSEWAQRNKGFKKIYGKEDSNELRTGIVNINQVSPDLFLISTFDALWALDKRGHYHCICTWKNPIGTQINSTPFFSDFVNGKGCMMNIKFQIHDTFLTNRGIDIKNLSALFPQLPITHFIRQDSKGHFWIGGSGGLWYLPSLDSGNEPILIKHNVAIPESISSDITQCMLEDRSGLIWFGTSHGGVNIYNANANAFTHINDNKSQKWHLNDNYIFGLAEDPDGNLWAGSMNGLHCIKFKPGFPGKRFENISSIDLFLHDQNNKQSLSENRTGMVFYAGHDSLFVSTLGGGLCIMNIRTGIFESHLSDPKYPKGLKNNYVHTSYRDKSHKIWVSTMNGPYIWNTTTHRLESPDIPWPKPEDHYNRTMETLQDSRGIYWFSQDYGLVSYDPVKNKTQLYIHHDSDKFSLSHNTIGTVFEDHLKRIWIGTLGGGLDLYDHVFNNFKTYDEKNGLASNTIYGILEDKKGNLWMSTIKGISMFNPTTGQFNNYGLNEGLSFLEFCQHGYLKTHDGLMFFGGEDGIIGFNPDEVVKTDYQSPLKLLDLKINYKSVGEGLNGVLLSEIKHVDLNYTQKVITFEFGTQNYLNPHNCKYAYKLEGFDNEWHYTDYRQRFSTYTNLPYGHYIFVVKSTDEFGKWMDKTLNISLKVIPPFWFTWWFITLASLCILAVIIYIVSFLSRIRLQRKLHKLEIANSLQSERERIARELHDNVGSQLTYIISKLDNAKNKASDIPESDEQEGSLENIGLFARHTMQQLRESIWVMNKDSFTLYEFELKLRDYISKYLDEDSGIAWKIEIDDKYNTQLSPAMVINLFRIIQESVNNTTKHAHATQVIVSMHTTPNEMSVIISDNGKGIDSVDGIDISEHHGFKNMKKRADEIKGTFKIETSAGSGTRIHLVIPL